MKRALMAGLLGVMALGCGSGGGGGGRVGGGDDFPNSPSDIGPGTSAEGRWQGSTSNGRTLTGVVLDDGSYWLLYSLVGNGAVFGGVLQGRGSSQQGIFTSTDGKDFNLDGLGINGVHINARYANKKRFDGSYEYPSNAARVGFTTTYDAAHDLAPTLAAIEGAYSGVAASFGSGALSGVRESATLTVATASGTPSTAPVSGSFGACNFSGSVSPRPRGNVYQLSLDFTGDNCDLNASTVSGVAFFDAASRRLHAAALNSARSDGFMFVGTKP